MKKKIYKKRNYYNYKGIMEFFREERKELIEIIDDKFKLLNEKNI